MKVYDSASKSSPGRSCVLALPAAFEAAGQARMVVAAYSEDFLADLIADAQLLVTEIVTNAVRHGQPEITLRLQVDPSGLRVDVTDAGAVFNPATSDPAHNATSGRGLVIVDALAHRWGTTPATKPPGKSVWFELRPTRQHRSFPVA